MSFLSDLFFGSKGKMGSQSLLGKEQMPLYQQLLSAMQGQGAGGAFGSASDYYRDLLDPNSQTAQMMFNPEMRRFNEDIIPSLAEQFAGMGSGALSSSGFRNAAVGAGTDLSERLSAIRAQLQQQGAAGLMGMGQFGLQPQKENFYMPASPGLMHYLAQGLGSAMGSGAGMF